MQDFFQTTMLKVIIQLTKKHLTFKNSHDSPDQNKYYYGENEVVCLVIQKIADDSVTPFLKILKIWYLKPSRYQEKIVQTP